MCSYAEWFKTMYIISQLVINSYNVAASKRGTDFMID